MKRIYLLIIIAVLPFMQMSAQSFTVFINNGRTVKYPAGLVSSIDYTSYQGDIAVLFNIGGGELLTKNMVDSIVFYEDEREAEILSGAPDVEIQYQQAYETVNLDGDERILLRFVAVRGDYPLSNITMSLGDDQADYTPEGKDKDVCYFWGEFSLEKVGKELLTVTVTDEDGQTSSTGLWLNTIPWPLSPTSVPDCFVYYPDSWFHFWRYDKDITAGKAVWWRVQDYDHATGIATILETLEDGTSSTVQLRRNHATGALEHVVNGTYYNLTDRTKELNFIHGYKTKEPSSLLGDMEDKITYSDLGGGVYSVTASEVYHQNSQDRYGWGWDLYNNYRSDIGYTGTNWTSYNNNEGPSASFGFHETLLEYYIEYPDGTYLYKKADLPPAPEIVGASTARAVKDIWTGTGEMITYPTYSFEFAGATDLFDFIVWTYDPNAQYFVEGPPALTFTYLTHEYNSNYKKVPVTHQNVLPGERTVEIRPNYGWGNEDHQGAHIMVLTARNPAGYSTASNMFHYVIQNGALYNYGFDDGSSTAPLRGSEQSGKSVFSQEVIDARDRLLEQLNSQVEKKVPAGK